MIRLLPSVAQSGPFDRVVFGCRWRGASRWMLITSGPFTLLFITRAVIRILQIWHTWSEMSVCGLRTLFVGDGCRRPLQEASKQ